MSENAANPMPPIEVEPRQYFHPFRKLTTLEVEQIEGDMENANVAAVPISLHGIPGSLNLYAPLDPANSQGAERPLGPVRWVFEAGDGNEPQAVEAPLQISLSFTVGNEAQLAYAIGHALVLNIGGRTYHMPCVIPRVEAAVRAGLQTRGSHETYTDYLYTAGPRPHSAQVELPFDLTQLARVEAMFMPWGE